MQYTIAFPTYRMFSWRELGDGPGCDSIGVSGTGPRWLLCLLYLRQSSGEVHSMFFLLSDGTHTGCSAGGKTVI